MSGRKVKELRKIAYDEMKYGEPISEIKRTKEFQSIVRARKKLYARTESLLLPK